MRIFSRYQTPRDAGQLVELDCSGDPVLVKQSFLAEVDINNIMKKYRNTGMLPADSLAARRAMFGDFSTVSDFQSALDTVQASRRAFEALPARIRDRFGNDPGRLVSFLEDGRNLEEAVSLGLVVKAVPTPVEPVPATASVAPAAVPAAAPAVAPGGAR